MSYTWSALYPKDESSTTVVVYDDRGIARNLTLTKDEFCGLHIPARSERTLNSIMVKELAREKREIEEAKKKADERSALRQSEIASAKATWPDKIKIVSHKVRVNIHKDGKMCTKVRCHKTPHIGREVNVLAPSNATTEELQNIAVKRHNEMMARGTVPSYVPKEFAAAVSSAANRRTQSDSSGSDSDGGSRGGYRSRRRSRRRGRKLRKQTRKH